MISLGRDSIEDFEDAGHSSNARKLMENYFIGEIDTFSITIPELKILKKDKPADFTDKLLNKATQYWAFPAVSIGIAVVVAAFFYIHKR